MEGIKAMIRNGRVETKDPLNFPEGTEVLIVPANLEDDRDDRWDNSPEGIAAWLHWYNSLEPLIVTPEEEEAWKDDRANRKAWELAQADQHASKLQRLWE